MRLYHTIWDSSVLEPVKDSDRGAQKQQTPLLIFTFLCRGVGDVQGLLLLLMAKTLRQRGSWSPIHVTCTERAVKKHPTFCLQIRHGGDRTLVF